MARYLITFLIVGLSLTLTIAVAAEENPRDRLSMVVGDWTIAGREETFREVCEWFHNKSHVVCNSENRGPKGTRKGVSVFSYSDVDGRYSYFHYGSSGVAVAQDIFFQGDTMISTVEHRRGRDIVREQVWLTPQADGTVEFREEVSTNGGPWEKTTLVRYVPNPKATNPATGK